MAKKLSTSPRGIAVYPWLNRPDTKFDPDGVFRVKLKLDAAVGAEFAKKIDKAIDKAVAKAKEESGKKKIKRADPPYEQNEEDGSYEFNFKMKYKGKTRDGEEFTRRPALFDAQGNRAPDIRIGGGSVLRISFEPYLFYVAAVGAGVSLRLHAVQVLELVEWGEKSAESYGFEAEEGFVADDSSPFESDEESDGAASNEDDDDDAGDDFDF